MYAQNLLARFRVVEHKVAEAHVLLHEASQVDVHLLRVLVYEAEALGLGLETVVRLGALQYQRHILVAFPYLAQQLEPGLWVFRAAFREARVAYYAQRVVAIAVVQLHGLLVSARQQHLRPPPLPLRRGMRVERLGREALGLQQYVVV